jgi:hypothetical protein
MGNWQPQRVLGCQFPVCNLKWLKIANWGCQFPVCNLKWLKNGKLRKAILSAFYNISQRNFGTLLILWCSFKLWWKFCLDQNLVYYASGQLHFLLPTKHGINTWGMRALSFSIWFAGCIAKVVSSRRTVEKFQETQFETRITIFYK